LFFINEFALFHRKEKAIMDARTPHRTTTVPAEKQPPRRTPKGRQTDPAALEEVAALLGDRPRRRDLLIEHLHLIQDRTAICRPRISRRSPPR
jgi:hypothetical protein